MTTRHDPYAGDHDEAECDPTQQAGAAQKARAVLELARQQNLTDGADRNDFARKLYLGLKGGKRRKEEPEQAHHLTINNNDNDDDKSNEDSSSEEEYVEQQRVEKSIF